MLDKTNTDLTRLAMNDSDNGKCGYTSALYYGGSAFSDFDPFQFWGYSNRLVIDLTQIELYGTYTFTFTITQINYNYGVTVDKSINFNVLLKRLCEFVPPELFDDPVIYTYYGP